MPFFQGGGGRGSAVNVRPPAPRPPAAPPPRVQANPDNQVQTPRPQGAPPSHTDITSSGPGYGSAAANAYKATPAYHQAVAQVFSIQPAAQKAAILANIARTPSIWHTPESQTVLGVWGQMDRMAKMPVASILSKAGIKSLPGFGNEPIGKASGAALDLGKIPGEIAGLLNYHPGGDLGPGNALTFGTSSNAQRNEILQQGTASLGKGLSKALDALRSSSTPSGTGTSNIASVEGGQLGQRFAKGATSDAANILGSPITTLSMVAADAPHPGKLLNDFTAFPKQALEDPAQAFINHPLFTAALAQGGLAAGSRAAAAPVRAIASPESAAGKAVSTSREGVWLTGNLTHERPRFSKSPTIKAQEKAHDALRFERRGKVLVPRSTHQRNKLMSGEIGRLVGFRERVRRVGAEQIKAEHQKAVRPSAVKIIGHSAKTALAYGPEHATIPGAAVMRLIANGTIRRPATYVEDLANYRDLIAKNRPNLLGESDKLKVHDAIVKSLNSEISAKRTPKQIKEIFAAAQKDAGRWMPLEQQGHALGQFNEMSKEDLLRSSIGHYAVAHMGAKFDAAQGTLVDVRGRPLSNQAILEHMNGPGGMGARMPTYVPDHPHPDLRANPNQSFYVPGERRPLPVSKTTRNTYYNYTHGLVDPSHMALLERKLELRGKLDAHATQNTLLHELVNQLPGGGFGKTFQEAKGAAPKGMRPINIAETFHPQGALDKAIEGVDPARVEEEATLRGIDLKARTQPVGDGKGRWGLVDEHALRTLSNLEKHISPSPVLRGIKALNNQFRTVVLSTSAKHVPGVMFENMIRDIGYGVGFRSWLTGHAMFGSLKRNVSPDEYRLARVQQTGGQAAGLVESQRVYRVSDHWAGTSAEPFLRSMEAVFKAPGARQMRTAWRAWSTLAIKGTKKVLEEQHQVAAVGKGALMEHGYAEAMRLQGFTGLFHRALKLQGQMLDDAAKGLLDPKKARQARALTERMYGRWTDLSPSGQTALMFSPFGLWWVNSARFLMRMPIDQPVKTALLASATAGTQQRRQAIGMDILGKGALPGYLQGGIPVGNKDIAMNYYSPFGTANDPLATGVSLAEPWWLPIAGALLPHGVNWLGKPLSSPSNPRGSKTASGAQKLQYVLNSALGSLVPLYSVAERIAAGGSSTYDTSDKGVLPNPLHPPTKTPGKGALAGLGNVVRPYRQYKRPAPGGSSGSTSSGSSDVPLPNFGGGGSGSDVPIPSFK